MAVAGAPNINNPALDGQGKFTTTWYRLFLQLWIRTGSYQDLINLAAPSGEIKSYAGNTPPYGYLLCDGSEVNRLTYNFLFSAIGTAYGIGDGLNTFNLPDGRGRTFVGAGTGAGLTARARGDIFGEETHILLEAELAEHTHTVTDTGHTHAVTDPGHTHTSATASFVNNAAGNEYVNTGGDKGTVNSATASATTGVTVNSSTTGITNDLTGSDTPFNVIQPSFVGNWIIKT